MTQTMDHPAKSSLLDFNPTKSSELDFDSSAFDVSN